LRTALRGGSPGSGAGAEGTGGGDSTIVASRSLTSGLVASTTAGCPRGTLGNAPPRGAARDSGAAGGEPSSDAAVEAAVDAGVAPAFDAARSLDRRASRVGPGQSHIDRPDSPGVCGTAVLAAVANAGVSPGSLGGGGGAGGSSIGEGGGDAGSGGDACAAGAACPLSESLFMALPLSSDASDALPS